MLGIRYKTAPVHTRCKATEITLHREFMRRKSGLNAIETMLSLYFGRSPATADPKGEQQKRLTHMGPSEQSPRNTSCISRSLKWSYPTFV